MKEKELPTLWKNYETTSIETYKEQGEKQTVLMNENGEEFIQEISSAKTSRKQIPKVFKIIKELYSSIEKNNHNKDLTFFDYGCGANNEEYQNSLEALNLTYYGCDLFNKPRNYNISAIKTCLEQNVNIASINNVLCVIKEPEIRHIILKQCSEILDKENGILFITVYEGILTAKEKEDVKNGKKVEKKPIKTINGWQNRKKTQEYIPEIEKVFSNVIFSRKNGIPFIVASMNKNADLEKILNIKKCEK